MRQLPKLLVLSTLAIAALMPALMQKRVSAGQQGWPPPAPGCHYTGNSACGGTDQGQCAPHERLLSQQCDNGSVINACGADDYCGRTSKGRFRIGGAWRGGGYQILQRGDTFSITGGGAGPANGSFTGSNTITVTWPQAHATFTAVISGNGPYATRIQFDHPAGNVWVR